MKTLQLLMKPNITALAYAMFMATNAAGIWGGVFPFLPFDMQSNALLFWFFLAQATTFFATFFFVSGLSYFAPSITARPLVAGAGVPYFLGWALIIGAMYFADLRMPLLVVGGACLGAGSAGFYLLWQRLFMAKETSRGVVDLMMGTVYSAVIYFALYLIPRAITVYLIPFAFMPLFALALVVCSREIDLSQPMFADEPRKNRRVYRNTLRVLYRSGLCVAALGFCTGCMRAAAIEQPEMGSYVNILSMVALLAAACSILAIWRSRDVKFNPLAIFRALVPAALTSLVLMPFLPAAYTQWLSAVFYSIYGIALLLMMIQTGQISRDLGVHPFFVYGLLGGVVYLMHDLGFVIGSAVELWGIYQPARILLALMMVYALAMVYFLCHTSLKTTIAKAFSDDSIELLALALTGRRESAEGKPAPMEASSPSGNDALWDIDEPSSETSPDGVGQEALRDTPAAPAEEDDRERIFTDRLSKQMDAVRRAYGLSARETEVAEAVARGKTVKRIAEELFVSENTVRTHTRRIYAKLGIHKKSELIDLAQSISR